MGLTREIIRRGKFRAARVCPVLSVSRSNQYENKKPRPRRYKCKDDPLVLKSILEVTKDRGTYGYPRVSALINRERRCVFRFDVGTGSGPMSAGNSRSVHSRAETSLRIRDRASGSTAITSQLPITSWREYLGGGRIADALLDRWIHNAFRFELNSRESLRKVKRGFTQSGLSEK